MRVSFAVLVAGAAMACQGQPIASTPASPLAGPSSTASARIKSVSCDCTSYPFRPNPPCFGTCIGKLAGTHNPDLNSVKGLDPGVAVSIKVLAASPNRAAVDFTEMKSKNDLEKAAERAFQGKDLKLEPAKQQFQLQR